MKKNDCNLIRDLMPLVIDRVASDESREAVEDHILTCEECKKQYDQMKADLPEDTRAEYEAEQQKFKEAMKSVRRTRLRRRIRIIALAAVVCLVAVFAGAFAYDRLFNHYTVPVELDRYTVSLAQLKDGSIMATADIHDMHFSRLSTSDFFPTEDDSGIILYLYYMAAPIHISDPNSEWKEQKEWMNYVRFDEDPKPVVEIRQGRPDHYITLWKTEDGPLPAASEQMETYFALERESWSEERKVVVFDESYFALQDRIEEARKLVPEWQ